MGLFGMQRADDEANEEAADEEDDEANEEAADDEDDEANEEAADDEANEEAADEEPETTPKRAKVCLCVCVCVCVCVCQVLEVPNRRCVAMCGGVVGQGKQGGQGHHAFQEADEGELAWVEPSPLYH